MRISIILLAVGVLFLLAVIALLCLKKLPLRWGVSLILCAAILCGGGTVFLRREQAQRRENYGSIYMALRYLENGRTDPAALYLRRTTLRNDYHLLAAQVLLEQLRGNDAMVQVRMNLLENSGRLSSAQEDGVAALQVWSPEKEKSLRNTVDTLICRILHILNVGRSWPRWRHRLISRRSACRRACWAHSFRSRRVRANCIRHRPIRGSCRRLFFSVIRQCLNPIL